MALISKGIELFYNYSGVSGGGFGADNKATDIGANAYKMPGLQEIGDLSGLGAGTSRDKIEITTLADDRHVYTDGLIADSDMDGITFKFLFDAEIFRLAKAHADWEQSQIALGMKDENLGEWIVRLPDGATFSMKATVSELKLDGAGVGAALTMTMSLTPYEEIEFAKASASAE
jgi:hypothetical protein